MFLTEALREATSAMRTSDGAVAVKYTDRVRVIDLNYPVSYDRHPTEVLGTDWEPLTIRAQHSLDQMKNDLGEAVDLVRTIKFGCEDLQEENEKLRDQCAKLVTDQKTSQERVTELEHKYAIMSVANETNRLNKEKMRERAEESSAQFYVSQVNAFKLANSLDQKNKQIAELEMEVQNLKGRIRALKEPKGQAMKIGEALDISRVAIRTSTGSIAVLTKQIDADTPTAMVCWWDGSWSADRLLSGIIGDDWAPLTR